MHIWPQVGKAEMRLRGSSFFFNFQKFVYILQLFVYNFSNNLPPLKHIRSNKRCFWVTVFYLCNFSNGTPCISKNEIFGPTNVCQIQNLLPQNWQIETFVLFWKVEIQYNQYFGYWKLVRIWCIDLSHCIKRILLFGRVDLAHIS